MRISELSFSKYKSIPVLYSDVERKVLRNYVKMLDDCITISDISLIDKKTRVYLTVNKKTAISIINNIDCNICPARHFCRNVSRVTCDMILAKLFSTMKGKNNEIKFSNNNSRQVCQ